MFPTASKSKRPAEDTAKKKAPHQATDMVCTPKDAAKFMETYTAWLNKPEKPLNPATEELPPYTKVDFDINGDYILPPAGVKLSDKNLYLVTKFVTFSACAKDYPEDFNRAGDVRADRSPEDPVLLFEVCGLYFFAVYKGYYILTGRQQAEIFGEKKVGPVVDPNPGWKPAAWHAAQAAGTRNYAINVADLSNPADQPPNPRLALSKLNTLDKKTR